MKEKIYDVKDDDCKLWEYNFVFFNIKDSYHEPLFKPISEMDNIMVYENAFTGNKILQLLCLLHWSSKINKFIRLPLKKIWFKKMCEQHFENDKPVCYVFYNGKYIADDLKIADYIKKKNSNNKIAIIYDDLISKMHFQIPNKLFEKADIICSYDQGECEKYNIILLESIYYMPLMKISRPEQFEYDVYFLGYSKNRIDTIHAIWRRLTNEGVKCRFLVAGTSKEQQLNKKEIENSMDGIIEYIENPIDYQTNLENIQNSRCILEIVQENSVATTLRANEAVCYKRKLITNSPIIKESVLYSSSNMFCYNEAEEINIDFCKTPIDYKSYDNIYTLSAMDYLNKIEEILSKKEID